MRKLSIAIIFLSLVLASCRHGASEETRSLSRKSDSMHEVMRVYGNISKVYDACLNLAYAKKSKTPELDAREMLIVEEGREKAEWFFARKEELDTKIKMEDSMRQSKLDSLKQLRK